MLPSHRIDYNKAAGAARRWGTPAEIRDKLRRRWGDGSLLRTHARGEPFAPVEIALRAPGASQIGERLGEVQDWIADLEAGSHGGTRYELRYKAVGGRRFGRNQIPTHAVVTGFEQAWFLLGVRGDVASFDQMLAAAPDPRVREWLIGSPLLALDHAPEWPQILAAYRWLDEARGADTMRTLLTPVDRGVISFV